MRIEWWTCGGFEPRGSAPRALPVAAPSLAQRRAAAMRRLFPLLSAWRAPPGYVDQVAAAYRDLAAARDPIDLEVRRRRIERTLRRTRAPEPQVLRGCA